MAAFNSMGRPTDVALKMEDAGTSMRLKIVARADQVDFKCAGFGAIFSGSKCSMKVTTLPTYTAVTCGIHHVSRHQDSTAKQCPPGDNMAHDPLVPLRRELDRMAQGG